MDIKVTFTRNWNTVGHLFEYKIPDQLDESIESAIDQAINVYSNSILHVILEQPSDWTPKSEGWTSRSGSSDLYFGEAGQFVMAVTSAGKNSRGIRPKRGDKRVFVGARYDVGHHSGFSMEALAGILQSTPDGSREVFARAYERVEDQLNAIFRSVGLSLK